MKRSLLGELSTTEKSETPQPKLADLADARNVVAFIRSIVGCVLTLMNDIPTARRRPEHQKLATQLIATAETILQQKLLTCHPTNDTGERQRNTSQ